MELHRIHHVDLVVVYIQSVDVNVYELIKLYQVEGILEIRASLLMPSALDTLDYNPNDETQWNNQVIIVPDSFIAMPYKPIRMLFRFLHFYHVYYI